LQRPDDLDRVELNEETESGAEALERSLREAAAAQEQPEEKGGARSAEALTEEVARLRAENEARMKSLVRLQADFENYRKRIERERGKASHRAIAALAESLLPVLDGFERALAAHGDSAYEDYRKGFELIYRQLAEALARAGVERIESVGKPFDPFYHHAIERVESSDHDGEVVIAELQAGYKLRDLVIRPAMVRVAVPAKAPAS